MLIASRDGGAHQGDATPPLVRVVDDEPSIQAVFHKLSSDGGFEVASYHSARQFLDRGADERPGCLVLDLMLGDATGIDVLKEMAARHDPLPVVFMSGMARVSQAVAALKLGSLDFVEKPFDVKTMLAAVRRAIDYDIARRNADREVARLQRTFDRLSARETEVMDLIVLGCANKEVAARLDLSPKTIEVHRANVMRKTEATSLAELVRMHVAVRTAARTADLARTP